MRNVMSSMNVLLIIVLISVYVEIAFCQGIKTCDPKIESCNETAPTPAPKAAVTVKDVTASPTGKEAVNELIPTPTGNEVVNKLTQQPTENEVVKEVTMSAAANEVVKKAQPPSADNEADTIVESPYSGGKDKFTVFAECCWELRLMYYWECDIYLKKCCMDSDITEYNPVCSSTGPGYIRWWKPYRRIFYNECAATKYLCESLPPLSLPWKCMWRRDPDHPHCHGSNKDVIRETEPPVLDCSRYGLESVGQSNNIIPVETNYFKHPQGDPMPKWKMPYPEITLSRCGEVARPIEPEPLLPFPPTPIPTPARFQELQELKSRVRNERGHKHEPNKTTPEPPKPTTRKTTTTTTTTPTTTPTFTTMLPGTVFFPSQPYDPPLMEIRTPESLYGMSLWAVLLGVFTVLFIVGAFIFSLWIGSKSQPEETRTLT